MKKLSTGNTGQNPPGLLKHFTGFWMSDVCFLKPYRTFIQPRCSTIGPSYPKQDVPWHQLDPKWDPENRWECASSIQTNPLNSLVNLEAYLIGWIHMWIQQKPGSVFFQQKPGAVSNKVCILKKMLKSVRWWMIGNWKTIKPISSLSTICKKGPRFEKDWSTNDSSFRKVIRLDQGPPLSPLR